MKNNLNQYYSEIIDVQKTRESLITSLLKASKEIKRWDTTINYSYKEYNNSLWNKRHNELTFAFISDSINMSAEREKMLKLLYDR